MKRESLQVHGLVDFWRQWGDALQEAGFAPNTFVTAHDPSKLVECLAQLAIANRRFPTEADLSIVRHGDETFPSRGTFSRLGTKAERIELVRALASTQSEFGEALIFLPSPDEAEVAESEAESIADPGGDGAVYMLKLGKHYKSFSVPRRHREISIELPEKPDVVHVITTDDPSGIETYWHKRFAEKRTNGEWFSLSREDIKAFRRRKFM